MEKHARYVEAIRELCRIFAKKRTMELKLRAVDLSDADLFYEWENEISLWESGNTMRPFSRYALENYVLTSQNEPLEVAKQMRLMLDACSEDMILTLGCVDLYDFDFRDSKAAVGIFICESERRKGYARKAVALLCDYVSRIYNLNQLYAFVASDNSESRSLFSACGFEQTACLKEWIQRGMEFKDVVLYQKILRNENKQKEDCDHIGGVRDSADCFYERYAGVLHCEGKE